ncbi:MBL fold metallo-hydrolase [Actinobacteria bacterium YIM 96077]|uniref:MBL fold metallo-hydrolase n=1 Tax=Phytoactinopolyspora halophila TaxID=1981511 RepID=A0A329QQW7_9ACTN|nr:MBL fold metallo-hydrolase [Phytoactinopolyspora halophila]AYY14228.1 MBL fold metallo-hydrolase [Actinobacteria bacterium YIM 96077]RAW14770.1 MBL fold metallo-hydrolase [Phytoactinopolyspora halophila]
MDVRIDHVTTSGTFSLDGQTQDVINNSWVVGDAHECVIIDAPHDAWPILELVGDRQVSAILLTHGHDDHLGALGMLWDETGATIHLHGADHMLWKRVYPDVSPDKYLFDGDTFAVGGIDIHTIHTPGHTPGSVCFYAPELRSAFTGDTLVHGGPGKTGQSFSDSDMIVESVRNHLFTLARDTVVHPGHGPITTVEAEAAT